MFKSNPPLPANEMLRQAFRIYQEDPDTVVLLADQILNAATQTSKLTFTITSSRRLTIAVGNEETFEVGLSHDGVSPFRTLLARFGVICDTVAEKRSLPGKAKAFLKRIGLIADKTVVERKDPTIEYVSAMVREQPGSPLYNIDADLDVKRPNGPTILLHLVMQNELGRLFLLIEPRTSVSPHY